MVVAGDLGSRGDAPRFAVAGAEAGDILFRVTGNMLSGKNGDGMGGAVPKGTVCLFRPFAGAPSKTDVYLIRRRDGQAFGATSAEWTVGMLQVSNGGAAVRVRYRAPQHMECVSEAVMPADAVEPLALFVKPAG